MLHRIKYLTKLMSRYYTCIHQLSLQQTINSHDSKFKTRSNILCTKQISRQHLSKLSNYTRVTSTTTTIVTQPVVRVTSTTTTNTTPSPMTGGQIISLTLYFTTGCQEMGNSQHGSQQLVKLLEYSRMLDLDNLGGDLF